MTWGQKLWTHTPSTMRVCVKTRPVQWSLTCNSYYDVLWRAALTVGLLGCRLLDVRGYIVLCSAGQSHSLLVLVLVGCCLGTQCILSCFWWVGRRDGRRGWRDFWQKVCSLRRRGCGGSRCCYGYAGLLRLKVLWVSRSCHDNYHLELFLWVK